MADRLPLGAPGVYSLPPEPLRALTGARMDVCAFVGVAPRGPARPPRFRADGAEVPCEPEKKDLPRSLAVPVESFDEYVRLYGGFEGPGRLPYAVASFFEQGGRRAYVVRIVHQYRKAGGDVDETLNALGVATAALCGHPSLGSGRCSSPLLTRSGLPVRLRARNEGAWGNSLAATLSFPTRPLSVLSAGTNELSLPPRSDLLAGSLLRLTLPGGVQLLRFVASFREEWQPDRPRRELRARLDSPVPGPAERIEVVDGVLDVDDRGSRPPRRERHERLGFSPRHPRWLAAVLCADSSLLYPTLDWIQDEVVLQDSKLRAVAAGPFTDGDDRYDAIVPEDFFDDYVWTRGDPCPGAGIHALVNLPDLGSLVVPDLYSPGPLPPLDTSPEPPSAGPEFAPCFEGGPSELARPPVDLPGLRLDPGNPADLAAIITLQQRVTELADDLQSFITLLDVPPGLNDRRILRWRQNFDSAYAAAYHPWLGVSRLDDRRNGLVLVNPAAIAAGIIAAREIALGIPHGPANELAAGVVQVKDRVSPARHDELHPSAINVFLVERDGVRLTAARTLSRDPLWRQLSVRRLVTMLKRTLDQQMQWAVFEPNGERLRGDLRHLLRAFLRQLYRANAFRGATEEEAFFVRCDEDLNPRSVVDQGRLIAQVGIAPAEPLEFIVLQIARDGDGTIRVEG